jgi:hypothetical protein
MKDWQAWLKKIENEFDNGSGSWLRKANISRTVHPNDGGRNIYDYVKNHEYFSYAADPEVGKPNKKFPNQNSTHSKTAVQSVYHITKLQDHFNINPKLLDVVTDIGGGYGHLCYTFKACGFMGEYNLIDFAVMHNIQSHFLSQTGLSAKFRKLDQLNEIEKKSESLLFASYSINEMPMDDRRKIEPFYKDYKYIMIVYKNNSDFGVDNKDYFNTLSKELSVTHNTKIIDDKLCKNDLILLANKK